MWRLIIPDFSQKIFRCTISELTLPCNISYLKDLLKTTFIPVLIGYDCLFPYLYRALRLFNFLIIVLFLGISLKKVEQKADQSQSAGGPSFFSNIPPPSISSFFYPSPPNSFTSHCYCVPTYLFHLSPTLLSLSILVFDHSYIIYKIISIHDEIIREITKNILLVCLL